MSLRWAESLGLRLSCRDVSGRLPPPVQDRMRPLRDRLQARVVICLIFDLLLDQAFERMPDLTSNKKLGHC